MSKRHYAAKHKTTGPPRCQRCGEPIAFKRLPNGKWCPTALDGTDHFDTCSRIRAEVVAREGTYFERDGKAGYRWQGKDHLIRQDGLRIVGENYVAIDCPHDCPPWETCACSHLVNGV